MKMKFLLAISTYLLWLTSSCAYNLEQDAYSFDNFRNTPLWELAQAVRDNDPVEVNNILKNNNIDLNVKDEKYDQTLLALSIINKKDQSFVQLLKEGANPNLILGGLNDSSALIYAVTYQEDCDTFYISNLLQYGADPNMKIVSPDKERYFENSLPLLSAIRNTSNLGRECIDSVKLLIKNGADINSCYQSPATNLCEGVITECLNTEHMETLRYFIIEKNIKVPDTVMIVGAADKASQVAHSLESILHSKYYEFDGTLQRQKKNLKNEILDHLKQNKGVKRK